MQYEYAVIDDQGQLMGMPTKTYETERAANSVRKILVDRHAALAKAADSAQTALDANDDYDEDKVELTSSEKAMFREMIETWDANKDRTYTVMARQVSAWEKCS